MNAQGKGGERELARLTRAYDQEYHTYLPLPRTSRLPIDYYLKSIGPLLISTYTSIITLSPPLNSRSISSILPIYNNTQQYH